VLFAFILLYFNLRVSAVLVTAMWLAGWLAVRHSRYCIKTTKPILKLFGPSGSPII